MIENYLYMNIVGIFYEKILGEKINQRAFSCGNLEINKDYLNRAELLSSSFFKDKTFHNCEKCGDQAIDGFNCLSCGHGNFINVEDCLVTFDDKGE